MKIKDNIEEYDVKSLDAIRATVDCIMKKCSLLKEMSELMQANIKAAKEDFTSENMVRLEEVIKHYEIMLENAERELEELLSSANDYSMRLQRAWRNW